MRVRVLVRLKDEVLDAPGRTLAQRLVEMGYNEVRDVHVGKLIELDVEIGDEKTLTERIEKMQKELLVNQAVEESSFEILDN